MRKYVVRTRIAIHKNTMKLGVALILINCFVAIYGQSELELQRKLRQTEDTCIGDLDVLYTIARIDEVRSTRKLPQDGSLDEFATCMLTIYQIFNADGTINTNVKTHVLISDDERNNDSYSRDCISKVGEDDKDTLRKIFECYLSSGIYIIDFAPRMRTMKPRSLF